MLVETRKLQMATDFTLAKLKLAFWGRAAVSLNEVYKLEQILSRTVVSKFVIAG
jgi:hypothetical protein